MLANVEMYGDVATIIKSTQLQILKKLDMSTKKSNTKQPCTIDSVISRFYIQDFRYDIFTNGTSEFKIKIIHEPSGISVDNEDLNMKSQYKTKQILILRLYSELLLNGL
ncbi:MAG: hypothetical protein GY679_04445 [Mycoplasma sp.]|nr:hypothetical protein [Mycoplasma sp.]